jgi:Holliday junction resolvase RusA-like endonuclease
MEAGAGRVGDMTTYDPAEDGRKSYDLAVELKRQRGDAHWPVACMVRVVLSDMPPSTNNLRAHFVDGAGKLRSAKTKRYAEWKKAAAWEIAAGRPGKIDGPYSLSLAVQRDWRSKRARDIDNIIKPVSDALVAAGVIKDDSLAERVEAHWADNLDGAAVVAIVQEAAA